MPYSQRTDGLDELRRTLAALPDEILDEGERIVGKAMSNIKAAVIKDVRSRRWAHLPHLPKAYSYDVSRNQRIIRGEAGADMDKLQGRLDVYVENGTADTPANAHWTRAFDAELPNFERYGEEYLARLLQ